MSGKQQILVKGDFITLEQVLKVSGVATTGGIAKVMIQKGQVKVDGKVNLQRSAKLRPGQTIRTAEFEIELSSEP